MSEIRYGFPISADESPLEMEILPGECLAWCDAPTGAQALLLKVGGPMPVALGRFYGEWKFLGDEAALRWVVQFGRQLGQRRSICYSGAFTVRIDLAQRKLAASGQRRKRAVVVDDSATMRKLLRHLIASFPGWEVVGEVERGAELREVLEQTFPDLVTLDLHLGNESGFEVMKGVLAPLKLPTILITSQPRDDGTLVMDTLAAGAVDYMQKPESGKWESQGQDLLAKMEGALVSKLGVTSGISSVWRAPAQSFASLESHVILIGSSTGGTQALQEIFLNLPKEVPPIVVVQHIPAGFSKALAERLNKLCPFEVKEAEDNDELRSNRILIAPGGRHLMLSKSGTSVRVVDDEPRNRFRPSVDYLFESFLSFNMKKILTIMLTGMGKDGAQMMKLLHDAGARTIAQDEATSVVFGMPREVIRLGAADVVAPLTTIAATIVDEVNSSQGRRSVRKTS